MSHTADGPLHIAGEWDIYPPDGLRRRLRYALKQAVFFIYLYCGWIQLRDAMLAALGKSCIAIPYYHRVGWMDVLSKPMGFFRADIHYLRKHYECLTLSQLVERLKSGAPIRRKIAVITFDDGYRDNYLAAFPELKRAGIPATFFVSTGFIGTNRTFAHDQRAFERGVTVRSDWAKMSWDELREMQAAGMEIGSHTVEHVNMGKSDEATARREVMQSLADLQRELGERSRSFCFPWGTAADISQTALTAIRESGYLAAVTTCPGRVKAGDDLFTLRRIDAGNGQFSRLASLAAIEGLGCGWLARLLRR